MMNARIKKLYLRTALITLTITSLITIIGPALAEHATGSGG